MLSEKKLCIYKISCTEKITKHDISKVYNPLKIGTRNWHEAFLGDGVDKAVTSIALKKFMIHENFIYICAFVNDENHIWPAWIFIKYLF